MTPTASPSGEIKICGLSTAGTLAAALDARADLVGFVSFPRSPRHVSLETMRTLAAAARGRAAIVALTVDAGDDELDALVAAARPDVLQLHGRETPARTAQVRARFGLPVMKALGIASAADVAAALAYREAADRLLFDAKPPKDASRPGGLGATFDWSLLEDLDRALPFMLSGGLDPDNVGAAIRRVRPAGVDVSSGVETAPGVKSADRIRAFIDAARRAFAAGDAPAGAG